MRNFRAQKSQNFGEADLIEREESLEMKHHLETSQIVQIGSRQSHSDTLFRGIRVSNSNHERTSHAA